jgi:hypothetical protein
MRRLEIMDGIQISNVNMSSIWLGTICAIFLEIKAKKTNFFFRASLRILDHFKCKHYLRAIGETGGISLGAISIKENANHFGSANFAATKFQPSKDFY